MELIPWRPFGRELDIMKREMDDVFVRFLGDFPLARRAGVEWTPRVDVSETKDSFIVKAEIPGLEADDISVSISGSVLTIKGEKKKDTEKQMFLMDLDHDFCSRIQRQTRFRARCLDCGEKRTRTSGLQMRCR